ncbi:MAG: SDR family NAD(P)-dependent oxidoreductase [Peptoanaerobacter stomatis]
MLNDKNIIVTGSNRGIGKSIVKILASNKANIWAVSRNITDEYINFLRDLERKNGIFIKPIYADMRSEENIKDAYKEISSEKKQIDGLVNTAGIMNNTLFSMTSSSVFKDEMSVNFYSIFLLTQLVSKKMQRQKNGSIVNFTSTVAIDGCDGKASYSATKGAILSFTKSIAKELGSYNVRANCIAPGIVDTDLISNVSDEKKKIYIDSTSLKRIAHPDEIANVALFLLSEYSSYITGQVIRVDGGL